MGRSFLGWLSKLGASIAQISGRPGSFSVKRTAHRYGAEPVLLEELRTEGQTLLLLTVPDRAIAEVAQKLAERPQAQVVFHASGTLGPEVLAELRRWGSAVGTFHPLRAFPRVAPSPRTMRGVFVALGGDPPAVARGIQLAQVLAAEAEVIEPNQRVPYHLAATLAAGGVATAWAAAWAVATGARLPAKTLAGLARLSKQAHRAAVRTSPPPLAVTGPALRGDLETLQRHLAWLGSAFPDLQALAVALAQGALCLRKRLGPLSAEQQRVLGALLRSGLTGEEVQC